MGEMLGGVTGNWYMELQHKTNAAAARANARVARAQGKAARGHAYGQALRIEEENKVAGKQASDAMANVRAEGNKAVGGLQAVRGGSGFTAEGSGMKAQVSAMAQLEEAAADMAYSRSLQDQSARFSAAMARKAGDIAQLGAEADGAYQDASAGIYNTMARNAARAANISAPLTIGGAVVGAIVGTYFGGNTALGAKMGAQLGGATAGMANSGRPGTYEATHGMGSGQMQNMGAGMSMGMDALTSWLQK